jgi:hypothetical protein
MKLPKPMLELSDRDSSEEAWRPSDFPTALRIASEHSLACLGGQFQFRGPIGIAEMYWIDVDSQEKKKEEVWGEFVQRSNKEVLELFQKRMKDTDFVSEAKNWKHIQEALEDGVIEDPRDHLYFVAYFDPKPKTVEPDAAHNRSPAARSRVS